MRFYTKSDAALLEQLTKERDELREANRVIVRELNQSRKDTIDALDRLAQAKAAAKQQPPELTREAISARLRIPIAVLDQIDFERLGMQVPEMKTRHQ